MDIPAHEILPGLWLGNFKASKDDDFFRQNNITVIFNCTKDLPFSVNIQYKYRVPLDDNLEANEIRNLALWAAEVALKIGRHLKAGDHVFVHCMAGMQRSAACVAIFLIMYNRMTVEDAIQYIKARRPIAFHGQANFLPSIQSFHAQFNMEILPVIERKQVTLNTL